MKKLLILLVISFLLYHNGNSQNYIRLHFKGDTISLDSAVVLDLLTYRHIRNYNISSNDLIESKIQIISALEDQVSLHDSIKTIQAEKLKILQASNARKDSTISVLFNNFTELDSLASKTYQIIEERTRPQPFYLKWEFWAGIGAGVMGGVFVAK